MTLIIVSTYSFDLIIMFLKSALTVNTYRHSYRLSLYMYMTLATLGSNTGACIYVKNTVKKPEKPKFEVFEPKVRRNETPQIAFHCVNEGFGMSAYGARFK